MSATVDDFETTITCEEYYMDEETLNTVEHLLEQLSRNSREMSGVIDRMDLSLTAAIQVCEDVIKTLENSDGSSQTIRL